MSKKTRFLCYLRSQRHRDNGGDMQVNGAGGATTFIDSIHKLYP